jgi:F-type H+-transporting ATPase subunit epsilon
MGILSRHTPLVAGLGIGEVILRQGPNLKRFLVQGGFAQVSPERVVLLADQALPEERIDSAEAEADMRKAAEALSRATMPEEVEAALILDRSARARLEILGRG